MFTVSSITLAGVTILLLVSMTVGLKFLVGVLSFFAKLMLFVVLLSFFTYFIWIKLLLLDTSDKRIVLKEWINLWRRIKNIL
ncbi:hypothetical protein [Thermodesulfovibrio sp. 3462-1]|uniref:Uncharacterized protein n=1 Tax=Thermodesulfovibrio obliviosus TaxID=3118332 RepID=A0AAU8H6D9_9BACT